PGAAARHGRPRLLHRAARGAAPVVATREERQLSDTQVAGDLDLGVRVLGVGDHPVDLRRFEPGVGDRRFARLDGQSQLRPSRLLRELGGADPDHGGRVTELVALAHRGSSTAPLPVTWSPMSVAPRIATSTTPSRFSVTFPVIVMVSPGWLGAPSRIFTLLRTASGPAQSVMNRPTNPFVDRMFMKMSGEPRSFARPGSWCTSW